MLFRIKKQRIKKQEEKQEENKKTLRKTPSIILLLKEPG